MISTTSSRNKSKIGRAHEEAVTYALELNMPISKKYNDFIGPDRKYYMAKLIISVKKNHPDFCTLTNPTAKSRIPEGIWKRIKFQGNKISIKVNNEGYGTIETDEGDINTFENQPLEYKNFILLWKKSGKKGNNRVYSFKVFSKKTTDIFYSVFPEDHDCKVMPEDLFPIKHYPPPDFNKNSLFKYVEFKSSTQSLDITINGDLHSVQKSLRLSGKLYLIMLIKIRIKI